MNTIKKVLLLVMAGCILNTLPAKAESQPNTQETQQWPISLGTSGGNIHDMSSTFCCSGTLGALVENMAGQYILSNNHVLARTNDANSEEGINQPGLIDQQCNQTGIVARLKGFVPIEFRSGRGAAGPTNKVDAAIALVEEDAVRSDGDILGIGPVSAVTVPAALEQAVQKTGRTTGHTVGTVTATDVIVDVGYSNKCGGGANRVARFVDQVRIIPGGFSAGGDSGSLVVEAGKADPGDRLPRAVGLLFAGSSTSTLANPIAPVLTLLGVTMVGGAATEESPPSEPDPPLAPVIQCIIYNTSGGPEKDRHLAIELQIANDAGEPLPGAAVTFNVFHNGSLFTTRTATTNSKGSLTFSANNASAGSYVTEVVNIVTPGLVFEGSTPENWFSKGTDSVPALFCRENSTETGATAAGAGKPIDPLKHARAVNARNSERFFTVNGVVGHGIGMGKDGRPVIEIYLRQDNAVARANLPLVVENVPVRLIVTGPFEAY